MKTLLLTSITLFVFSCSSENKKAIDPKDSAHIADSVAFSKVNPDSLKKMQAMYDAMTNKKDSTDFTATFNGKEYKGLHGGEGAYEGTHIGDQLSFTYSQGADGGCLFSGVLYVKGIQPNKLPKTVKLVPFTGNNQYTQTSLNISIGNPLSGDYYKSAKSGSITLTAWDTVQHVASAEFEAIMHNDKTGKDVSVKGKFVNFNYK